MMRDKIRVLESHNSAVLGPHKSDLVEAYKIQDTVSPYGQEYDGTIYINRDDLLI